MFGEFFFVVVLFLFPTGQSSLCTGSCWFGTSPLGRFGFLAKSKRPRPLKFVWCLVSLVFIFLFFFCHVLPRSSDVLMGFHWVSEATNMFHFFFF